MPRQRTHYRRRLYVFPDDFPKRLKLLKEESGLAWAEMAHRPGTYPLTIRRRLAGVRPNLRHQMALLELWVSATYLTAWSVQHRASGSDESGRSSERVIKRTAQTRCRSMKGKAACR